MYKEKWSLWVHYDKRRAKRAKLCPLYRVKNLNLSGADFFNCGWWIWCVGTVLCTMGGGPLQFHDRNLPESWLEVRSESSPGGLEQSQRVHGKGYRHLSSSYWQLTWCYQSPVRWSYRGGDLVVGISVQVTTCFFFIHLVIPRFWRS